MFVKVPDATVIIGRVTPEQAEISRLRYRIGAQVSSSRIRAKKLGIVNTLTRLEWETVLNSSKGFCVYCERQVGIENLGIDHITPVSKGGANAFENITASCFDCNCKKNAKDVAVWLHSVGMAA